MQRTAGRLLAATLAGLGACGGATVSPRVPLEEAVLAVALDSVFAKDTTRFFLIQPLYVYPLLSHETEGMALQADSVGAERVLEQKGIAPDLAHDFVVANARLDSVHLPIPAGRPVVVDTLPPLLKAERDSILAKGRFGSGFERVKRAYPGAHAVIALAHAGFSLDQTSALVLLTYECGKLCGGAELLRLVQRNGHWVIAEILPLWVS